MIRLVSKTGLTTISESWDPKNDVTLHCGDCLELLAAIPDGSAQLIVTSPPYNIGKQYERRVGLDQYLRGQRNVIHLCADKLRPGGSICWQVGNHVNGGEITPLDVVLYPFFKEKGLKLRNRIVWRFEHGLHCSRRFSGRYETILWFSKDDHSGSFVFNLDPIRVPQKYPGKLYFKGPKKGLPSANPLGKNPGDVWDIPNVKHNHPEKTVHPCQFPVELVERLVLALTNPSDLVLDPYMGVGSALIAAIMNGRRAAGADISQEYCDLAKKRIGEALAGTLKFRPRNRPIYQPPKNSPLTKPWWKEKGHAQSV